jgi:hypothetical protein
MVTFSKHYIHGFEMTSSISHNSENQPENNTATIMLTRFPLLDLKLNLQCRTLLGLWHPVYISSRDIPKIMPAADKRQRPSCKADRIFFLKVNTSNKKILGKIFTFSRTGNKKGRPMSGTFQ